MLYSRELRRRPEEDIKTETSGSAKEKAPPVKCRDCKQLLDDPDLKMFAGDSADAV